MTSLTSLEEEVQAMRILIWPASDDASLPTFMQAAIVMKREGGLLVALPGHALLDEVLESFSAPIDQGSLEPLVGPFRRLQSSILDLSPEPGGEPRRAEETAEVILVDLDLLQVEGLIQEFQTGLADHMEALAFLEGRVHAIPMPSEILEAAREWVTSTTQERLGYYTAQEEAMDTPPRRTGPQRRGTTSDGRLTPATKKAAAKKPTVAGLSSQVETLLAVLPQLTDQLHAVATRQEAMESQLLAPRGSPQHLQMTGRAATPVSAILASPQLTVPMLPAFAKTTGPPPRTKPSIAPTAHLRDSLQEEPLDLEADVDGAPLEPESQSHHFAAALLEQSKALRSLVNHLSASSSDPMSELTGSSSGLGVKGAAGREKLQLELYQQRGTFFLKVCQAIHRRQQPTQTPSNFTGRPGPDQHAGLPRKVWRLRFPPRVGPGELGLVMWSLGHIFDAARDNNMGAVRDHTALLAVMLEQAALDGNQWGVQAQSAKTSQDQRGVQEEARTQSKATRLPDPGYEPARSAWFLFSWAGPRH